MVLSSVKLKRMRQERGWSQEQLANISGVSLRTVQRIEKDGNCSVDTQVALASAFSVAPTELQKEEEKAVHKETATDWGGITGVGLSALLIAGSILLAEKPAMFWDFPSLLLIVGLMWGMTVVSCGLRDTSRTISSLKWLFVEPGDLSFIHVVIPTIQRMIFHVYTAAFIATMVGLESLLLQAGGLEQGIYTLIAVILLPILYAAILAELLLRPLKFKTETLLSRQLHRVK